MKLSSRKELLKEASLLLKEIKKEIKNSLNEDLGSFKEAGIPDGFSKYLLRTLSFRHDAEIQTLDEKPKASDLKFDGIILINVASPSEVHAVFKSNNLFFRIDYSDSTGGTISSFSTNFKKAFEGMGRGKYFKTKIPNYALQHARKAKLTPSQVAAKSTADPLAGSTESIYEYMNDVFLKGMKPQLESMIDDIYTNLRKMSNSKRPGQFKNDQKSALDFAKIIQSIMEDGFTRQNMEEFLSSLRNKKYTPATGVASFPKNEKKLQDVLKNVPNARAKWAKVVLDTAKELHKRSMELVNKASK